MSAVPLFSQTFLNRVAPSRSAVKKLDAPRDEWATSLDVPSAFSFCPCRPGVENPTFSLKQSPCPHCGCVGALNRHSRSFGNDPSASDGQTFRGQRVFCSNRGQREGCGRTFAFCLADILPRHTLRASVVWPWLVKLLAGLSLKAATEQLRMPFALETMYRLRRKWQRGLDSVRTQLCRRQAPPPSTQTEPWLQTVEHLQRIFPGGACPPVDYQLEFQRPFLG